MNKDIKPYALMVGVPVRQIAIRLDLMKTI